MKLVRNLSVLVGTIIFCAPAFADTKVFKLYDEPRHVITPDCDVYTELKLTVSEDRSTASAVLTDKLAGECEILIVPNVRGYKLAGADDGCGSFEYSGMGANRAELKLTDNRGRLCQNIVAATIVTKEISDRGEARKWSFDGR